MDLLISNAFIQLIYKSLYNWIIGEDKNDFPRHRVFDPFFSYLVVIVITFFL